MREDEGRASGVTFSWSPWDGKRYIIFTCAFGPSQLSCSVLSYIHTTNMSRPDGVIEGNQIWIESIRSNGASPWVHLASWSCASWVGS